MTMTKWILRILVALVVLVVLAVIAVGLFLGAGIKRGVEVVGPMVTGVEVKLESVRLSLLSGSGKVQGFVLGNPKGFHTTNAISVGSASLALSPGSLFSDKIVIKSIAVEGPEITYETSLKSSNLGQIQTNLKQHSGGSPPSTTRTEPAKPGASKAQKKLEVDDFIITGGKVHVSVSVTALGGKAATVALPTIHLKDLGKGPDGITAEDLATIVLDEVCKQAVSVGASAVADLEKSGAQLKGAVNSAATNAVESIKGIGDLFKK
jgi:hypothetical protein